LLRISRASPEPYDSGQEEELAMTRFTGHLLKIMAEFTDYSQIKITGGKMSRIKFVLTFFVLFFTVLRPLVAGGMGDKEMRYLKEGLESYNLTLDELKFDKKWVRDDTFRLKVVTRLMDNPLDVPDFISQEGDFCDSVALYSLSKLLIHTSYLIDAPVKGKDVERNLRKKNINWTSKKLSDKLNEAITLILTSFEMAEPYLKKSFNKLTEEEIERLLVNAPIVWSDDEDSLEADSLKGILYKEFALSFDTTSLKSDTMLKYIKNIDRISLLMSSVILQMGVEQALKTLENVALEDIKDGILLDTMTTYGRIVIGGTGNNSYKDNYALIIDIGGDDHYSGRFASGIGIIYEPFSVLIDLSGDDIYTSEKICNIGSGLFGCGILVDLEGKDVYRGHHNSVGAGLFGTGIIIDNGGNDLYEAGYFSEGAGFIGTGILYDSGGDDFFRGFDWTQGFGSIFGYGLLINKGGNDVYRAGGRYIHHPLLPHDYRSFAQGFGMGFRPDAGGGIGFLYDTEGNDFYNSEVFTQGGSYWYSLGMLLDRKGNDYYNACQYAQGSGIHLSIGMLLDEEGNDHYFSRFGPSQGEGHDLAVGFLIDRKGNDSYMVSGGQGVGLTNSCGIFIDCEGNDLYASSEKLGQGSANSARGFGGFGAFIDIGGRDTYPKSRAGADETIWTDGSYGVGMDVESGEEPEKKEYAQRDTLKKDATVEELFETASLWEVAENKERVRNARERLKDMGLKAIEYVIENKMETKSGLELRAIEELAKAHPDSIEPLLLELIKDESRRKRGNGIWVLGKIKSKNSVDSLTAALSEKRNWRLRNTILRALGEIEERKASQVIIPYLDDEKERVKITSARALGRLKNENAIMPLIASLKKPFFTVRLACENGIVAIGDSAVVPLLNTLEETKDAKTVFHSISALGRIAQDIDSVTQRKTRLRIKKVLLPYLDKEERSLRAQAVKALSLLNDEDINELLKSKKNYETDPFVIGVYRKYIE